MKIVEQRDIQLNTRLNLTKVETGQRIATFEVLDEAAKPTGQTKQFEASAICMAPNVVDVRNYDSRGAILPSLVQSSTRWTALLTGIAAESSSR